MHIPKSPRKTRKPVVALLLFLVPTPAGSTDTLRLLDATPASVVAAGAHERAMESVRRWQAVDGAESVTTNRWVELATGLNRRDAVSGAWVPAEARFETMTDGSIVASRTAHQVILAANLNQAGAVDLLTPDGQRLRSTPVGLAHLEAGTGRNVLLAEVRDCRAGRVSATEVLYPDAFDGLAADVRFSIELDRFEQDVIFRAAPPGPELSGLDPARTQLVVLTECQETTAPAQAEDEAPGWLRFGAMALAPGRAFVTGTWTATSGVDADEETAAAQVLPADGVPVAKSWEVIEDRTFLMESVEYTAVATALADLPAARQATVEPQAAKDGWALPAPRLARVASRAVSPDRIQALPAAEATLLAALPPDRVGAERPGLVLDYVLLTSQTSLTLAGDTTYYVTGAVNVQNLTIEGGAVVKYDTPSSARIAVSSSVTCRTGPYRPAFFTHKFDSTVGEPVATGVPTNYVGNPMLDLSSTSGGGGLTLEHLRFRHAQTAVKLNGSSTLMLTYTLRHAQFVRCQYAINSLGNSSSNPVKVVAGNLLAANLGTFLTGYYFTAVFEHLTADTVVTLASGGFATNPVAVTNSVLANITTTFAGTTVLSGTHNGFWNCTPFGGAPQYTAQSTPFETVAAGAHYSDQDSDFVDRGTFNVSSTLLNDLRRMTTRGPVRIEALSPTEDQAFLPHDVEGGQIWWQDGDAPDLGYHYALLDYYATGLNLGRTLALAEGVAIGFYGATGITLGPGAKLVSVGKPHTPNQLVRLQAVQEMAASPYTDQSPTMTLFKVSSMYSPWPEVTLHYTDISLPAGSYDQCHVLDARQTPSTSPTYPLTSVVVNHCQIWGGRMMFYPGWLGTTVTATNVLWHRGYLYCDQKRYYGTQPFTLTVLNNLFYGGTFACHYSDTATPWTIKDNLFDRVALQAQGNVNTDNAYNGYHQATALPGPGTGNKTLTTVNYQYGPRGYHYYPNSGTTGLRALVNAGSTSADARDLYLFTTQENQAPEGNTTLDIGYHYPPAVKFQTVTTNLVAAVDLDYHPGNQSLIVSVNCSTGYDVDDTARNFRRVAPDRMVSDWALDSNGIPIGPLEQLEAPLVTVKQANGQLLLGDMYYAYHIAPLDIYRVGPTGLADASPWLSIPDEDEFPAVGMCIDQTGVFEGAMFVITGWLPGAAAGGNVWRVNPQEEQYTNFAELGVFLEGVMVCPNDTSKYGPSLAGRLLVGAPTEKKLFALDPAANVSSLNLGVSVLDLHTVSAGQWLYCVEFKFSPNTHYAPGWFPPPDHYIGSSRLLKLDPAFFANVLNDILLVRSGETAPILGVPDGALFLLHWTGSRYVTLQVSDDLPRMLEHAAFAPVSMPANP